ncbi:MAG TPA: DNA methyltransferase [Pirellulales bacterium]|jgi:hypothetical protein|nr:DNA methyltransferase [Pirellulales bacterium]
MNTSRAARLKNSRSEFRRVRADSLGRRLTQRILRTVLPQLATGLLAKWARRRRTAAEPLELSTVLDGSMVLLFRLLFLLHAEARGLRSHSEMPGGGASLAAIAAEIAGAAGNDRRQVSQRLAAAYAAGSTVLYDRLKPLFQIIPAATDERLQRIARFLAEHKVPDRALALAIDGLARDIDQTGALVAIDYRSLDVRHLGSIYESLLEQQLVASGRASVELSRDTTQRRATGSFYTPPAIVEHIIEQTVGAVLDEKLAALRPEFQAACEEGGMRAHELVERLFDIRVLDPAMGTGNFLLAAAECISQRLASFLAEFPIDTLQGSNARILLKQQILQRCLYGVDLDPLAVELAKFCLWLDSGQSDALLPALDHLRCGNALVGARWQDLPAGILKTQTAPDGKCLDRLSSLRGDFDLLTASHFDLPEAAQANLKQAAAQLAVQPDLRFFHWELEFPEVFFDAAPGSSGFDAVVGNPPYVDSETMTRHHARLRTFCARTLPACRGNWDLFCAFMDRGLSLLNERGIWSQIVPNKLLAADYSAAIQQRIGACTLLQIRDYSRASVFEDVSVYPIVPVIAKRRTAGDIEISVMEGTDPAALRIAQRWSVPQGRLASLPPGCWSPIVSRDWQLLEQILENSITLEAAGFEVRGAATVAEAYRLAEILQESDQAAPADDEIRLLNSGTIDPFRALWGQRPTRYLNVSYALPVVRRADLERLLPTRATQAASAKAVVAGMTQRIEAVFDSGQYLAGKSTTIIRHADQTAVELLVAILNSAVTALAFRRLFESLALSGGYLRVGPPQLRRTLVPKCLMSAIAEFTESETASPGKHGEGSWPASVSEAYQRLLSAGRSAAQSVSPNQTAEIDQCAGFLFGLTAGQTTAICEWLEHRDFQSPVSECS